MPVITFKKKYLYSLLGSGIDDKKLNEQVIKMGFEVESLNEDEVLLEITPNRLDLIDAVGFARSMKNFMHKSKKFSYSIDNPETAVEITVDSSVKKIRPYISGLAAFGVKLTEDSMLNLINFSEKFCETYGRGRKKIAIGMHNLDKMKTQLVYKCDRDMDFVPLGETAPMKYSKVLESNDKGKKYSNLITDGKSCYYPSLSDSEGAIAFIPILNSERTKLTEDTRNMFVDITGTSEYAVNKVADLLAATFFDMGADVRRVKIKYPNKTIDLPELEKRYININLAKAETQIGVDIGFNNVISLANKMGYEAALIGNIIRFRVPEYRLDVIGEQDVIEDIAIGYGYDYINPLSMFYSQQGGVEGQTILNRRAAEAMIGMGFSETASSYLTNEEYNFDKARLRRDRSAITMKNPKTETVTIMRTWILPSLFKSLGMSAHESMPQRIFEVDMAFSVKEGMPAESYRIGAVSIDPKSNFNEAKSYVEGFLDAIGIEHSISSYEHKSFIDGRCAEIRVNGKHIGFFGEIHPEVLKNFGIEEPGIAFEMDLSFK